MSRIATRFEDLRARQRTALVPFITAGDPALTITVPIMHALVEGGADIIELGVPFSDPMADGPVIQRASERALKHHVSLTQVLALVREFRAQDSETPVVLMGYLNPVEVMGYERFARDAAAAGVDGALTVDMPPEEADDFARTLKANGLDPVFLLAPTSTDERIRKIAKVASGFIYYVSLRGVTGAANLDMSEVATRLEAIRQRTSLPLGVGFGIRDAESAARMARIADAVVVGSALVARIAERAHVPQTIPAEARTFIATLRKAMDDAAGPHAGKAGAAA
jgi:tryptophan synthase alpha chain